MDVLKLGTLTLEKGMLPQTDDWLELHTCDWLVSEDGFWLNDGKVADPGVLVGAASAAYAAFQTNWREASRQRAYYIDCLLRALAEGDTSAEARLWQALWEEYCRVIHPYLVPLLLTQPLLTPSDVPEHQITIRLDGGISVSQHEDKKMLRPALTLVVA